MMSKDILEIRARELARRGEKSETVPKTSLVVAEWDDQAWGFELGLFHCLLETVATPCPSGVTWRGLSCSAFLYHQSKVYPVVRWSSLVGLPDSERVVYAVMNDVALELSGPCRVEKFDLSTLTASEGSFCRGRLGELKLSNLEALS